MSVDKVKLRELAEAFPSDLDWDSNTVPFSHHPCGDVIGGESDGTYTVYGKPFRIEGEDYDYDGPTYVDRCGADFARFMVSAREGVMGLLAEIDQLSAKVAHQETLLEQKRVEIYEEATNAVESYKRVTEIKTLLTYAYNSGYMAGHHDTVDGQFSDIHHADMRTHHHDVVAEIIAEQDSGGKEAASVTISLSGCTFTENELLERVMHNIEGVNRYGAQRWVRVKDVFGCGSGVSHALCYRFGLDPDQDLKKR